MKNDGLPRFGAEDVIHIVSKLALDDATFLVGGQAVNLWAWIYKGRDPALDPHDPMTSRDLDYFGTFQAAQAFADALDGTVSKPDSGTMNSPNTALVTAVWDGKKLEIDFLNGILGVSRRELENGVSALSAAAMIDGKEVEVRVAIMHPVSCLKSRVANMLSPATMRRDRVAWSQLHAAIAVLNCYLDDALMDRDWKEAKTCIQAIATYLRSNSYGRQAKAELGVDLIDILKRLEDRPEIDERYREKILRPMISVIEEKQAARLERR